MVCKWSHTGAAILRRLAQECDILVESFPSGYQVSPEEGMHNEPL